MKNFGQFSELGLVRPLMGALDRMGFLKPTAIQGASIPAALEGRDVLGIAQTGTGKTGAFGIPLLSQIYARPGRQALVLAPTRELAAQISKVFRQMAKRLRLHGVLVVGGESFGRQVNALDRGVDFIIATPGRLMDHLREGTVDLSKVSFLVLDEVDRMLDMGFAPQVKQIIRNVPRRRQTLLFSATLPPRAKEMANQLLRDPVRVTIQPKTSVVSIKEKIVHTTVRDKGQQVVSQMKAMKGKTLIFARTKSRTERVARILGKNGFKVVNLHGGRTQGQRKRALDQFRCGSHPIMVATDIAGRGIDVVDIDTVVNYDLPRCREDYIHRVGRTARNGRSGLALNFVTKEDSAPGKILGVKVSKKRTRRPRPSR